MPSVICKVIEVCIFKFENDRPQYLLLRRAPDQKLYPGIWQLVSGSIENGERALDAAYRELREETGFAPARCWVVPFVDLFYDQAGDRVNVCPVFAAQVESGETPRLSAEHCGFGWFSVDDAHRRLVWPGQRSGLRIAHEYIVRGEAAAGLTRIL